MRVQLLLRLLWLTALLTVLCSDKKLEWFRKRGWTPEEVEEVRQLVIRRWNESYKPVSVTPTTTAAVAVPLAAPTATSSGRVCLLFLSLASQYLSESDRTAATISVPG
jgi:hypothetical protein